MVDMGKDLYLVNFNIIYDKGNDPAVIGEIITKHNPDHCEETHYKISTALYHSIPFEYRNKNRILSWYKAEKYAKIPDTLVHFSKAPWL